MKNTSLVQLAALAPFAATEDQQLSINSAALINGSGQTLRSVSGAAHGTVTLRNGKVVFRPDANFSGIATFDYTLVDSHGVATVQTATVDVAPVADAPAGSPTDDGGETLAIRSMMYLALTYDHRVVDGADAGRFLSAIKARLEEGAFEV